MTVDIKSPIVHSEKNGNHKQAALNVNHLSKCFKLYDNPWHRALEWMTNKKRLYHTPFWALKDISFTVNPGEIFGIIGQNGAGKSTLLKVLAGIIQPTAGSYEVAGKLLAMLELGMDFNPNLSGKENIFRTAELWGFPKDYTKEQFAKIIAFSELGDFIERPVKLYSSGMSVRLAFSLFAFLKCDVLVIDEVLAVGDLFFHQKCYQRIEKLVSDQTTIILVTHNLADIQQFCDNAIVLDKGKAFFKGDAKEAVYVFSQIKHRGKENIVPIQKVIKADDLSSNQQHSEYPSLFSSNYKEASIQNIQHVEKTKVLFRETKPCTDMPWPPDESFISIEGIDDTKHPAQLTRFAICNDQRIRCNSFQQSDYINFFMNIIFFRILKYLLLC
ncbi:MAG: lipopolysaccharide transport system ATP-binding protein [Candidatus Magnetoglobus multicellularis str. Araruama]|uniref:Lipopolysaccharide transport system ATP-binding protein n=1 Tax=Candidatus Magnetoglobus multicellularis str. Araruama TaxID=890399 RepID=A0A1V1P1S8_9BACT|nr:MAG: lipopolysaccharide transport system ATP-binding protein [Candidatus Magnetoglobus multicellularis str. Araruama]